MKIAWTHNLLGLLSGRLGTATLHRSVAIEDESRERRLGTREQQIRLAENGDRFAHDLQARADAVESQ